MNPLWLLCALLLFGTLRFAQAQNQVLDLDGKGSYVQLPAHIFDALEEATVEAWVKWEDWGYFSQWFAFGADDQWKAMGINHSETTSTLQFFIYTGLEEAADQERLHLVRLGTDLPLGQWCHLAAVSGRGGMRFYLNGMLVGHNGFEGSFAALSPGGNNYLGKSNWKENAYFRGQLDEVRVWSMARSGEEIRAGMGQPLRGDEAGLVGLWNFDAGDAGDQSPQGHAGQLIGGARCMAAPFPGAGEVVQPAVVEGVARDETSVPLNGAVVHLRQGEAEVVGMRTWLDGHYALAVMDAGSYALEAGLGEVSLQWGYVYSPTGGAGLARQEVLLREGEVLHQDLSGPPSQVAWWRGEGDARDALGQHDGTLMGDATLAPGLVGQAFSLDGRDDYIRVPHAADPNLTGSISLVAWVFPTAADRAQNLFYKEGSVIRYVDYQLFIAPGMVLNFGISDGAYSGSDPRQLHPLRSPVNALTRNTWNQVVAVYDQGTGTRYIYVNGTGVTHEGSSLKALRIQWLSFARA